MPRNVSHAAGCIGGDLVIGTDRASRAALERRSRSRSSPLVECTGTNAAQHAVHEATGVVGAEALRQLDGFVEHDGDRHVGAAEQLEGGDCAARCGRWPACAARVQPLACAAMASSSCCLMRLDTLRPARVVSSSAGEICAASTSLGAMPFDSASYSRISARSRASVRSSSDRSSRDRDVRGGPCGQTRVM